MNKLFKTALVVAGAAALVEVGRRMMDSRSEYASINRAKGKVKQKVGDLTDNRSLYYEGVVDEAVGTTQHKLRKAHRAVDETAHDVREHADQWGDKAKETADDVKKSAESMIRRFKEQ